MNIKRVFKLYVIGLYAVIFILSSNTSAQESKSLFNKSTQLIVVVTDSVSAVKGTLYYFERNSTNERWTKTVDKFQVVLGRSGLGWGSGLNKVPTDSDMPQKKEGDGRSPAGVFGLGPVFGYEDAGSMHNLNMPYVNVSELTECIDDVNSQYYNQIINRNAADTIDWNSSEKMRSMGIYYELGIVVEHNADPVEAGKGSCIFLHNWSNSNEKMAGCTAMAPENLKKIVYWLDESKNPLLVQLTAEIYAALKDDWKLPSTSKFSF